MSPAEESRLLHFHCKSLLPRRGCGSVLSARAHSFSFAGAVSRGDRTFIPRARYRFARVLCVSFTKGENVTREHLTAWFPPDIAAQRSAAPEVAGEKREPLDFGTSILLQKGLNMHYFGKWGTFRRTTRLSATRTSSSSEWTIDSVTGSSSGKSRAGAISKKQYPLICAHIVYWFGI